MTPMLHSVFWRIILGSWTQEEIDALEAWAREVEHLTLGGA